MFVHELVYLLAETSVVVNNGAKVVFVGGEEVLRCIPKDTFKQWWQFYLAPVSNLTFLIECSEVEGKALALLEPSLWNSLCKSRDRQVVCFCVVCSIFTETCLVEV